VVAIGPRNGHSDYSRLVIRGKKGDKAVTHIVFVYRFNQKGTFIETAKEPIPPSPRAESPAELLPQ
jgi:hypothetical protein